MENKLILIKKTERAFRQLLEVTEEISADLKSAESMEDLQAVAAKLRRRDALITAIKALETGEASSEEGEPGAAYEKYRWLCREVAKKISRADQENVRIMNEVMGRFMDQVRSSRQSMRAVSAYAAQSMDDGVY